jgi:hypothetical protein
MKHNRWFRMAIKILASAILIWGVQKLLMALELSSWSAFSKKADAFAARVLGESSRLTPVALWHSIRSDDVLIKVDNDQEKNQYFSPELRGSYRQQTFREKVTDWLDNYWYTADGKRFWIGRVLLLFVTLLALWLAVIDYQKAANKATALLLFPFRVLFRFFGVLLGLAVLALLFYLLLKLLLMLVGGIVALFTTCVACGGFLKLLAQELQEEVGSEGKKTFAGVLLPFIKGRPATKEPVNRASGTEGIEK